MANINNRQALDRAMTTLDTAIDTFIKTAPSHDFECYARMVECDGNQLELPFIMSLPVLSDWIVNREYSPLTAQKFLAPVKMKQAATTIALEDINGDKQGLIAESLAAFAARIGPYREQIAAETLLAGFSEPGFDGVSYFNSSHVDPVTGATFSNTSTSALTALTFNAAAAAMMSYSDNGTPLGIVPRVLMVGPSLRKIAQQIVEGELRIIPINASGDEASTSVVAAAASSNVYKGWGMRVVVNPRLVGTYDDYWFVIDDSNPKVRPVVLGEQLGGPIASNDWAEFKTEPWVMFAVDYGVAQARGPWQCSYGNNVS